MRDRDLEPSALRTALLAALIVLTIIAAMGVAVGEAVRRLRAELRGMAPQAVELGRRLERLRHDGTGTVVPFRRRRPVGG